MSDHLNWKASVGQEIIAQEETDNTQGDKGVTLTFDGDGRVNSGNSGRRRQTPSGNNWTIAWTGMSQTKEFSRY